MLAAFASLQVWKFCNACNTFFISKLSLDDKKFICQQIKQRSCKVLLSSLKNL